MPSPSLHLIWSKHHTSSVWISSRGCQGHIINHAFTTALHSLILPYSTDILLSFNTLFTPSIHPAHELLLNLTTLTLKPTILFTILSSFILSMCPNHLNTHCSAPPANYLVTPVLPHTTSFFTWSICVTPHTFLRHFISITFDLFFSATAIHYVSAPCRAVSTATPSYNLLFTFIPITLLLNILIPPNTFSTSLILLTSPLSLFLHL